MTTPITLNSLIHVSSIYFMLFRKVHFIMQQHSKMRFTKFQIIIVIIIIQLSTLPSKIKKEP